MKRITMIILTGLVFFVCGAALYLSLAYSLSVTQSFSVIILAYAFLYSSLISLAFYMLVYPLCDTPENKNTQKTFQQDNDIQQELQDENIDLTEN